MGNFNSKAASLAFASALAALSPYVKGYFSVTMELDNDIIGSVGAQNLGELEVITWRVWTHDENFNEKEIPSAFLDSQLIEAVAGRIRSSRERGVIR